MATSIPKTQWQSDGPARPQVDGPAGEATRTTLHRFAHGLTRMGDFVRDAPRNGNGQQALPLGLMLDSPARQGVLPLFSPRGSYTVAQADPAYDFALYADAGRADDLAGVLEWWQATTAQQAG